MQSTKILLQQRDGAGRETPARDRQHARGAVDAGQRNRPAGQRRQESAGTAAHIGERAKIQTKLSCAAAKRGLQQRQRRSLNQEIINLRERRVWCDKTRGRQFGWRPTSAVRPTMQTCAGLAHHNFPAAVSLHAPSVSRSPLGCIPSWRTTSGQGFPPVCSETTHTAIHTPVGIPRSHRRRDRRAGRVRAERRATGFLRTHARLLQVCSATREPIGNRSRRRRTPRFASPAGATAVPGTQP